MNSILLILLSRAWVCTPMKKSDSDTSNLNLLMHQLTNLEGVDRYNLFVNAHLKCKLVDRLQGLLTKSHPTMSMKNSKSLNWSKYEKPDYYTGYKNRYYHDFREDRYVLNYPSRSALFIYVFSQQETIKSSKYIWYKCLEALSDVYSRIACPSNIPKILLIITTNKTMKSYDGLLKDFVEGIMDAELLEIASPCHGLKRQKRKLARTCHVFTVHQWNCFPKVYKRSRLFKNITWFEDKLTNLHGYKMTTKYHVETVKRYDYLNKRVVYYDVCGVKSKLAAYLKASLNFTLKCVKKEPYQIKLSGLSMKNVIVNTLDPLLIYGFYLYTPIIIDCQTEMNVSDFLICFVVVSATCLLLLACAYLGGLNRRTWSPLSTAKMLLGLENPCEPQFATESILFIVISVCGIFCSNEIYEGLTGLIVPIQSERNFYSLQDIKSSNITLILRGRKDSISNKTSPYFIKAGLKVMTIDDRRQREIQNMYLMIHWKNISVTVMDRQEDKLYDSKITVHGRVIAKRSDIPEYIQITSIEIESYSRFREKLSKPYWRFFEHGFNNDYNKYMHLTKKARRYALEKTIDRKPLTYKEGEDSQEPELSSFFIFLTILAFGDSLALLTLLGEISLCSRIYVKCTISILKISMKKNHSHYSSDLHF